MKKLFFLSMIFILSYSSSNANNITIHNLTGCSYTLNIMGYGPLVILPNTLNIMIYTSGSNYAVKVVYDDGVNYEQVNADFYNPIAISTITPPCMSGPFKVTWLQAPTTADDATIFISQ